MVVKVLSYWLQVFTEIGLEIWTSCKKITGIIFSHFEALAYFREVYKWDTSGFLHQNLMHDDVSTYADSVDFIGGRPKLELSRQLAIHPYGKVLHFPTDSYAKCGPGREGKSWGALFRTPAALDPSVPDKHLISSFCNWKLNRVTDILGSRHQAIINWRKCS